MPVGRSAGHDRGEVSTETAEQFRHSYRRLTEWLFEPIDIASLALFRICFGLIMFYEVVCFFAHGWIDAQFVRPVFHFKYYGFEWVHALPGAGMYVLFALLGVLALCIAVGFFYRAAAALFAVGFTYVFLIDQARYLNHFYLVCLVSMLLAFLPLDRAYSIDAYRKARSRGGVGVAPVVPAWPLWLLRAQVGIVYFYGGIAKINQDWLRGAPMDMWLAKRASRPLLGPALTLDWMPYFFSYGGLLLDLFIVPFLLWRRTRMWAFGFAVFFHLMNSWMFTIGIFPWFMLAATTLFFAPVWPRRAWALVGELHGRWTPPSWLERVREVFVIDGPLPQRETAAAQRRIVAALGVYLLVQLLVPLRHHLYPGVVHWNEEGHRFSWHMKLRTKIADARFRVSYAGAEGERETWEVVPTQYLRPWQVDKMAARPDMILQFAHFLADSMREVGFRDVEVRADVMAALNGREPQPLIDPEIDLARQPRTLGHVNWVLPLDGEQRTALR